MELLLKTMFACRASIEEVLAQGKNLNDQISHIHDNSKYFSDSGGPLTVDGTNGQKVQVGLVSFGNAAGCERGSVSFLSFVLKVQKLIV